MRTVRFCCIALIETRPANAGFKTRCPYKRIIMTITANAYPTAYVVYELLQDYLKKTQEAIADWDEFVYDFLSDNYDHLYLGDPVMSDNC